MAVFAANVLSCAGTNPGLQVQGLLAPASADTCTYAPGAGALQILNPTLDVFRRTEEERNSGSAIRTPIQYRGVFQVVSFLAARASRQFPLQVDPNTLNLTSAEVTLRNANGSLVSFRSLPNPFSIAIAQIIRSSQGAEGSYGTASVPVIPPQYGEQLEAAPTSVTAARATPRTILASVKVTGVTVGGQTVDSSTYTFPLTLCDRCLVSCERLPAPSTMFAPVVSCSPGQDDKFSDRQAEVCN